LLERVKDNPRRAERGIIFIDEIDKLRRMSVGDRDVSGEGVQNALLTMLDGRIADSVDRSRHPPVDTSRILFICTGAFVGLHSIVQSRLGVDPGRRIGFRSRGLNTAVDTPNVPIYEALCQTTTEDLVAFGFIPELIGRFATITALHELGRDDLRALIDTSIAGSPLARQTKMAEIHGIRLTFTPDALQAIVDRALRMGTGARALPRLLGMAIDTVDYRWGDLADDGVTHIIFDREAVLGDAEPRLERGDRTLERLDDALRLAVTTTLPPPPARTNDRSTDVSDLDESFIAQALSLSGPNTRIEVAPGVVLTRASLQEINDRLIASVGPSDVSIRDRLDRIKNDHLDWGNTSGSAKKWWNDFENRNESRLGLVLEFADELRKRKATITDIFLCFMQSNTDNIYANLHYLDYTRLKRADDEKRRGSSPSGGIDPPPDTPADGDSTRS